jgi:tetratricopeptide (TPR) repeat protein
MDNKYTNIDIFENTECPSDTLLLAYAKNNISKEDRRLVELHLIDCEMCNDVVEGYQRMNPLKIETNISNLEKKIDEAVVWHANKGAATNKFKWYYAAAAVLIIGLTGILYQFYFQSLNEAKVADMPQVTEKSQSIEKDAPKKDEVNEQVVPEVLESMTTVKTVTEDVEQSNTNADDAVAVESSKKTPTKAIVKEEALPEKPAENEMAAAEPSSAQTITLGNNVNLSTSDGSAQFTFSAPATTNYTWQGATTLEEIKIDNDASKKLSDVVVVATEKKSLNKSVAKDKSKYAGARAKKTTEYNSEKEQIKEEIAYDYLSKGNELLAEKKYQLAISNFKQHLLILPKDCEAILGTAQANESLKNLSEAIKYYLQLSKLKCDKKSDSANLKIAELYLQSNQKDKAIEVLQQAQKSKYLDIAEEAKKLLDGLK